MDYVFQYAPFGPGWFVLRCRDSSGTMPIIFETHPLKPIRDNNVEDLGTGSGAAVTSPPGLQHFNETACNYHDRTHTYTEESMMLAFAQRVVDEDSEDVTDEWARESNEHLQEKLARHAARKARRAARRAQRPKKRRSKHRASTEVEASGIKREAEGVI